MECTNLYGLDREELAAFLEPHGTPPFHARQIFRWLYARSSLDPAAWTDLPRALRDRIRQAAVADAGGLEHAAVAPDGTVKYRARTAHGDAVECVSMRQSGRVTLCISSQVGCALACDFCLTGKMGWKRNLSTGEIVAQVALIRREQQLDGPFNLVFMGMGEPLHNYDAVAAAIRLLCDGEGFGISRRRITVSTAGLAPEIERLAQAEVRPRLAISLNATTDSLRDRLMPINRKYPIARLLEACRRFSDKAGSRVTFEYVLLEGVNDSDEDVRRLAGLVRPERARVNLIPFNAVPGRLAYRAPAADRVRSFCDGLLSAGVAATVRFSRGADARAACGQLALFDDDRREEARG